jgi:dTDP-4-amino-4,6-dideoxygalactose transaminase
VPGLTLLAHDYDKVVPHLYVVCLPKTIERQKLRQTLSGLGIQTGVHYQPNHQLALYGDGKLSIPLVETIYPRLLSLPMHPDLSEADVRHIAKKVLELIELA